MQGILYEHANPFVFVTVTLLVGGVGAWSSGKAVAASWSPLWKALLAAVGLSLFVRFLHYALFEETLLSLRYWLVDLAILLALATLGWRMMRVRQMVTQYPWLYERAGLFGWRERGAQA